jgi:hypothetical protein
VDRHANGLMKKYKNYVRSMKVTYGSDYEQYVLKRGTTLTDKEILLNTIGRLQEQIGKLQSESGVEADEPEKKKIDFEREKVLAEAVKLNLELTEMSEKYEQLSKKLAERDEEIIQLKKQAQLIAFHGAPDETKEVLTDYVQEMAAKMVREREEVLREEMPRLIPPPEKISDSEDEEENLPKVVATVADASCQTDEIEPKKEEILIEPDPPTVEEERRTPMPAIKVEETASEVPTKKEKRYKKFIRKEEKESDFEGMEAHGPYEDRDSFEIPSEAITKGVKTFVSSMSAKNRNLYSTKEFRSFLSHHISYTLFLSLNEVSDLTKDDLLTFAKVKRSVKEGIYRS